MARAKRPPHPHLFSPLGGQDDLNRSNSGNVTEKLQYDMPEPLRKKLEEGLARLTSSGLAAATAAQNASYYQSKRRDGFRFTVTS